MASCAIARSKLSAASKLLRRASDAFAEVCREVALIRDTDPSTSIGDGQAGREKQYLGEFDPTLGDELVWWNPHCNLEAPGKVERAQDCGFRDPTKRQRLGEIGLYVVLRSLKLEAQRRQALLHE